MKWASRFPKIPIWFHQTGGFTHGWFLKSLLMVLIAWLAFEGIGPRKPVLPDLLRAQVEEQTTIAVEDLAGKATRMKASRIAVLQLGGDDSDYATATLRQKLADRGVGQQPTPDFAARLRNFLHLDHPAVPSKITALTHAKEMGLSAVVYGCLRIEGTRAWLDLKLADVNTGQDQAVSTVHAMPPPTPVVQNTQVPDAGAKPIPLVNIRSILACALIVLLLPVFTIRFVAQTVRRRSNAHNGFALAVYTVADILVAGYFFALLHPLGLFIVLLIIGIASFAYNVSVMTWALKSETGQA